jgi:flagellar basal-body rod protein FlgF
MDSGFYAAFTGLVARSQAMDLAATNLANAQTPGYRSERDFFRSVLLGPDAFDSQLGMTVNRYGLLGGDLLNLTEGALQQTGNPLDLTIEGQGFFVVQTANGPRYTRDGGFHRSPHGLLVTGAEEPVLSSAGQQISLPPGEVAVGSDGVVSVDGGAAGNIAVVTFPPDVSLIPEGTNRYKAPEGAIASPSRDATVHEGAIEVSNQNIVQGTINLIMMQRQAEMMQRALTVFHTDLNKFATEDLPRV